MEKVMKMEKVESGTVRELGYDERKHVLRVRFASGAIYDYFNVPARSYKLLKTAESVGAYLNRKIKGFYKFEKVA
jgi:hypothetical protein